MQYDLLRLKIIEVTVIEFVFNIIERNMLLGTDLHTDGCIIVARRRKRHNESKLRSN